MLTPSPKGFGSTDNMLHRLTEPFADGSAKRYFYRYLTGQAYGALLTLVSIMDNLRQLHIIRGLAALYVAVGHAKVVFWSGGAEYLKKYPLESWNILDFLLFAIDMLSSSAQEFVIVFFVLSGFFINYSFNKNNWKMKDFLINRIVRIYPPYLFSVLISIFVFKFIHFYNPTLFTLSSVKPIIIRMTNSYSELDWTGLLKSLFYLPQKDYIAGNLSYWSLLPEWIFYLIIPFTINSKQWLFIIFVTAYFFDVFMPVNISSHDHILKFVFEYGFYFYLGVISHDVIFNTEWKNKMPSKFISYCIAFILLFTTIILGVITERKIISFDKISYLFACLLSLFSMMTLLKYPVKGGSYKIGVYLGDISYSLYVFHLPIYYLFYSFLVKHYNTDIFYSRIYWLVVPFAILGAHMAYLLVEKHTLKYIKTLKLKR